MTEDAIDQVAKAFPALPAPTVELVDGRRGLCYQLNCRDGAARRLFVVRWPCHWLASIMEDFGGGYTGVGGIACHRAPTAVGAVDHFLRHNHDSVSRYAAHLQRMAEVLRDFIPPV